MYILRLPLRAVLLKARCRVSVGNRQCPVDEPVILVRAHVSVRLSLFPKRRRAGGGDVLPLGTSVSALFFCKYLCPLGESPPFAGRMLKERAAEGGCGGVGKRGASRRGGQAKERESEPRATGATRKTGKQAGNEESSPEKGRG